MSRQQMRRLGHRRRGALLAAALLLAAPTIEAQIKPVKRNASMDWVVPYCAEAVASAKRGYGDSQFGESLGRLQGCGTDGADAAAAALRSLRSVSDTTVLDSLTLNFQAWRDAVLFDAGLRLARNASATPESRVFAIRYLYSTLKPQAGSLFYGELTRGCNVSGGSSVGFGGGRLLASNYPDILRRLGNQLADSAAIPGPVRAAAFCLATIPKGLAAPEPPAPPTGAARAPEPNGGMFVLGIPVSNEVGEAPSARTERTTPTPTTFVPPEQLPDYRPAFGAGALRADADGRLWVRTLSPRRGGAGPQYDVLDSTGALTERVMLPPDQRSQGLERIASSTLA